MSNWLSLGGSQFVDGAAVHNYPNNVQQPELVLGQVALEQAAMQANGVGNLPIFDTESGWGETTALPSTSDQVNFLARHLILQDSASIAKSYWCAYDNTSWGGLWQPATSPWPDRTTGLNPAGIAYNVLSGWLTGAAFVSPCAADVNVANNWSCSLTLSSGKPALLVWNTSASVPYLVDAQFNNYATLDGVTHPIQNSVITIGPTPLLITR